MRAMLAREPVDIRSRRREDPLPHPLSVRARKYPNACGRQSRPAGSGFEIEAMLLSDAMHVPGEGRLHGGR
jgi:hypothetical protein